MNLLKLFRRDTQRPPEDATAEEIEAWVHASNLEYWRNQPAAMQDHDRLVDTVKKTLGKDKAK